MSAPLVVNAGSGHAGSSRLPLHFDGWREFRVDVAADTQPDLIGSITDLSAIPDGIADAVWSSHCIEHLYAHEVSQAMREFARILAPDGFACIIVPDLQAVAEQVAADRMHDVLYESAVGPVTAHDMFFGLGAAVAQGHVNMAHKCGFTPTLMAERLRGADFAEIIIRRRPTLELAAVARKRRSASEVERDALLAGLQL